MVKATTDCVSQLICQHFHDLTIGELNRTERDRGVSIQHRNAQALLWDQDEFFDVAVCGLVICLAESIQPMLAEVRRVLKPTGQKMFSGLADYLESSFLLVKTGLMRKFGDPNEYRSICHLQNQELLDELDNAKTARFSVSLKFCGVVFPERFVEIENEMNARLQIFRDNEDALVVSNLCIVCSK